MEGKKNLPRPRKARTGHDASGSSYWPETPSSLAWNSTIFFRSLVRNLADGNFVAVDDEGGNRGNARVGAKLDGGIDIGLDLRRRGTRRDLGGIESRLDDGAVEGKGGAVRSGEAILAVKYCRGELEEGGYRICRSGWMAAMGTGFQKHARSPRTQARKWPVVRLTQIYGPDGKPVLRSRRLTYLPRNPSMSDVEVWRETPMTSMRDPSEVLVLAEDSNTY